MLCTNIYRYDKIFRFQFKVCYGYICSQIILRGAEAKSFENHNIQFLLILMQLSLNQAEEV